MTLLELENLEELQEIPAKFPAKSKKGLSQNG
jgi:hypothetical protein